MTIQAYLAFIGIAALVVLMPGPDFALVTRNTLSGGPSRGRATALGVGIACAVQGAAAVTGLGALIRASQPLFEAIKWAGVVYLAYLAVQSFRAAWRAEEPREVREVASTRGLVQGFLCNITNPKALVFYLALLPQFMGDGSWGTLALLALTHAVLGVVWLLLLASLLGRLRPFLTRKPMRRTLDAATGTALGAFSLKLALDHG